jgi:flagellar hook assembly protein FlgD
MPSGVPGQVITGLSAIPNPLSPNGDGMLDQTTIRLELGAPVDSLLLSVENDGHTDVWTLTSTSLAAGDFSWVWAGTTSAGGVFSDGVHQLRARAFLGGAVADSALRLLSTDISAPRVVDFQQIRSSFAPDAEFWNVTGLRFGIETEGPASDTTLVSILRPQGSHVASLGGFGGEIPETTFYWDGTDTSGALVEEGTYLLEVTSADEAGNRDSEVGSVYLDLAAPSLSAGADTVLSAAFPETLSGWATDVSGVAEILAREGSEGEWEALASVGGDSVVWEYVFGESADEDGWYEAQLIARDVFGHEADPVTVILAQASYSPVHVSSSITSQDTIFANGDEVRILSRWDRAGYTVQASFDEMDSQFSPGGVAVSDNEDSTYTISYFVSVANTRENAVGLAVWITATHVFRADSAVVWVELRNEAVEPPPPGGLTLDQNLFNPDAGEVLTIGIPQAYGGSRIEIYTLMGERVWSQGVNGMTSVVWNGRNSEGEMVASGVYLVRLGANVRKIGVVK